MGLDHSAEEWDSGWFDSRVNRCMSNDDLKGESDQAGVRSSEEEDPLPVDTEAMDKPMWRPVPWSKSEVLERLGEDEALLRELCAIFLSESAKLLDQLRRAVESGEPLAIMRAAHSLKGEVSYLSAPAATQAARLLEDLGHAGEISAAPEALIALEREMKYLHSAIQEYAGVQQ